ncbi:hypothetical protein [Polaribacter uvawellassae]|uniref:hypothetical protein n=1 Tax=Polaribacter uvawellassae TaxID=3133495 RepID=UPI00321B2BB8
MKKIVNTKVIAIVLLALSISFTSCNRKKKTTATITPTVLAEEIREVPIYREAIVFITGVDSEHSNYYTSAKMYFEEKQFEVITEAFSLQEIISWLNNNYDDRLYSDIHIVSENNPWKGMHLETAINGEIVNENTLRNALLNNELPKVEKGIADDTNVVFHVPALANNTNLIEAMKTVFSSNKQPNIVATPFYTVFGGEFSKYHLAKPFYGFYPTAHSPGKVDLSKAFAKKYPQEDIDWLETLYNESERYVGDPFTTQFNLPIKIEVDYTDSDNGIPTLTSQDAIMDFIEADENLLNEFKSYNIPIEKFRWKTVEKEDKLIIKGITTVLCVLKPIIKPYGDLQHVEPEIDNLRLYNVN